MKYYVYAESMFYKIFREYDDKERLKVDVLGWIETEHFVKEDIRVVKGEEVDLKSLLKSRE